MNNNIFEKFLNDLNNARSIEEKEYAMIAAYDAMDDANFDDGEKMAVWNQMMLMAQ